MKAPVLTMLLLTILPLLAHGIGKEGGGGQGILCQSPAGALSLEPLDLFEAKTIWGANLPASQTLEAEVRRILPNYELFSDTYHDATHPAVSRPKATPQDEHTVLSGFIQFQNSLRAIPATSHLTVSADNGGLILQPPAGCQLVQILYYADIDADTGQILVDQAYWNLLNPQSRLALYLHELIYKQLRPHGETTSVRTRRLIGMMFDSKTYPGASSSLYDQTQKQYCTVASDKAMISFWALPVESSTAGKPLLKLAFSSLDPDINHLGFNLVDTTATLDWSFETWTSHHLPQLGEILQTSSALGSVRIMLKTYGGCIGGGAKRCQAEFALQKEDMTWTGGPVTCVDVK